jgi:hypothetical protein
LIEKLTEAADVLAAAGCWSLAMAAEVVRLLGSDPDPLQIGGNETCYRLCLYNLHCQPDPRAPEVARAIILLSVREHRPAVLHSTDLRQWVPAVNDCRRWLRELLEAELASLRFLEEAVRTGKQAVADGEIMNRERLLSEGETSRQYLRYHREADNRFCRGHRRLEETVRADATHAARMERAGNNGSPDHARSAGGAAGVEWPETSDGSTTGKSAASQDQRNEPGNGTIGTTVMANGNGDGAGEADGNGPLRTPGSSNGLMLVLLGVLLGQLLGAWGRTAAWPASLPAPAVVGVQTLSASGAPEYSQPEVAGDQVL